MLSLYFTTGVHYTESLNLSLCNVINHKLGSFSHKGMVLTLCSSHYKDQDCKERLERTVKCKKGLEMRFLLQNFVQETNSFPKQSLNPGYTKVSKEKISIRTHSKGSPI